MKALLRQFFESKKSKTKKHSHQIQEDLSKNKLQKYKTELCKTFQATGRCSYGVKCKFAHGSNELIIKHQCQNYKKKFVKVFKKMVIVLMEFVAVLNIVNKNSKILLSHIIIYNFLFIKIMEFFQIMNSVIQNY